MKKKKFETLRLKGVEFLNIVGESDVSYTYNWNTDIMEVELEKDGELYNRLKDEAIKIKKIRGS